MPKNLETRIEKIGTKIELCAWKRMLQGANKLTRRYSYQGNKMGVRCDVCSGDEPYHKHKICYQTMDEVYKKKIEENKIE